MRSCIYGPMAMAVMLGSRWLVYWLHSFGYVAMLGNEALSMVMLPLRSILMANPAPPARSWWGQWFNLFCLARYIHHMRTSPCQSEAFPSSCAAWLWSDLGAQEMKLLSWRGSSLVLELIGWLQSCWNTHYSAWAQPVCIAGSKARSSECVQVASAANEP